MVNLKNRVKELRLMPASKVQLNSKNPRRHGDTQRAALRAILHEIGFAGAVLAYEHEGKVICVDGAMRRDELGDAEVPVLITDLTPTEAEALLLYHDSLTGMAEYDPTVTLELLDARSEQDAALAELHEQLRAEAEVSLAIMENPPLTSPSNGPASTKKPESEQKPVRCVLYMRELEIFEKAILKASARHPGESRNRGAALTEVCRSYLESQE